MSIEAKKKAKLQSIEYLGGKCVICGYNKCNAALEFHHINPLEKDLKYDKFRQNAFTDKLKLELDKCILLCANCHREYHSSNN
jgi:5-methylcytosine-specific restriction endonuclease McrA